LNEIQINELCALLGSDLNFCLYGGTAICTGRGENIQKIQAFESSVSLVKPKKLGISAKEAYVKFSMMSDKTVPNNTEKMLEKFDETLLYNSLENAVIKDYKPLLDIKRKLQNSLMSGSGPTFFVLQPFLNAKFDSEKYLIIENLHFISSGVEIV